MSKQSELHALRYSFSGDKTVTAYNRSGDSEGNGAERWNFIASVQSAEADIIDEEERAERQEAKRKFAKLLWLYFKKILNPIEFEFLKEYLKGKLTPHKVGIKLGLKHQQTIDYKPIVKSILLKHKKNEQNFLLLIQYSGLKLRKSLEFLPQLEKYYQDYLYRRNYFKLNDNEQKRQARKEYRLKNIESERERKRVYRATHRKQISDHNKELYANPEYRQKKREYIRLWELTHKEQKNANSKKYRARNAEKLKVKRKERYLKWRENATPEQLEAKRERDRKRRQSLTPEQLETMRERKRLYCEQNRDKFREYRKKYQQQYRAKPENKQKKSEYAKRWYEKHKDEINARKRAKRAAERETRKTSIPKTNARERAQRVKTQEIRMKETKTVNFIKQRAIKQKFDCLAAFLRSLSYDFINKIWVGFSKSTADEEAMTDEERAIYFKAFYCSVYNAVVNEVQALSKILVNDISVVNVIQEERERAEHRREEIIGV